MRATNFDNAQLGLESPGQGSFPITKSDSTVIAARSLYIIGAGDVCFIGVDGTEDTWTVPANFIIPIAVTKVKSTGTTATGIHGIA